VWETLHKDLTEKGAGFDPTFGIADGDTTSVTTLVLKLAGYTIDSNILAQFEGEKHIFRTYDYERNASISTNVHALEALSLFPQYPNRRESQDRILAFLLGHRAFDTYWVDKWHASPYYSTAHVLAGISRASPSILGECRRTIEWLVHTQREDGSWGFFDLGTAEETAYALAALLHCSQYFPTNKSVLRRGAAYLYQELESAQNNYHYPPLWIDKSLYVPQDIVKASILATLILYEETFVPL